MKTIFEAACIVVADDETKCSATIDCINQIMSERSKEKKKTEAHGATKQKRRWHLYNTIQEFDSIGR